MPDAVRIGQRILIRHAAHILLLRRIFTDELKQARRVIAIAGSRGAVNSPDP